MTKRRIARRRVIQSIAATGFSVALKGAGSAFPGDQDGALKALAAVVLPSSLGRTKTDTVADRFIEWVRGYAAGAEMEHGYGFPKLESRPPSPAALYLNQLRQLALDGVTNASAEKSLTDSGAKALPRVPAGKNVVLDLMSFYFHGPDAADQCYGVAIRSGACRGFENVGEIPRKIS